MKRHLRYVVLKKLEKDDRPKVTITSKINLFLILQNCIRGCFSLQIHHKSQNQRILPRSLTKIVANRESLLTVRFTSWALLIIIYYRNDKIVIIYSFQWKDKLIYTDNQCIQERILILFAFHWLSYNITLVVSVSCRTLVTKNC